MGIVGLISGIVGILFACCGIFGLLGIVPASGGLGLGLLGRKAADVGQANNRGLAQAAFVVGIVATSLCVLAGIFGVLSLVLNIGVTSWNAY